MFKINLIGNLWSANKDKNETPFLTHQIGKIENVYSYDVLMRMYWNKNSHIQLVGCSPIILEGNLAAFMKMKNLHTLWPRRSSTNRSPTQRNCHSYDPEACTWELLQHCWKYKIETLLDTLWYIHTTVFFFLNIYYHLILWMFTFNCQDIIVIISSHTPFLDYNIIFTISKTSQIWEKWFGNGLYIPYAIYFESIATIIMFWCYAMFILLKILF